jgi:hypothetical protein
VATLLRVEVRGALAQRILFFATLLSVAAMLMFAFPALAQREDLPPGGNPLDPPGGVRAPSKEGPPEGKTQKGQLPEKPQNDRPPENKAENNKELLEAGGDLPTRQGTDAGEVSEDSGRFPLWRVAGMILSAGVFVFSVYRLLNTSQQRSWLHRFFFGS